MSYKEHFGRGPSPYKWGVFPINEPLRTINTIIEYNNTTLIFVEAGIGALGERMKATIVIMTPSMHK